MQAKIGSVNVLDILSKVENLQTETEYGYSEQKAIGEKPTLVAKGESLRRFSLPIKLHVNFCNPDKIIAGLREKGSNNEIFSYFQGSTYIGEFVISKVAENIIEKYNGITHYAEITVDLIEAADKKETFSPQTKTLKNPTSNLKSVNATSFVAPVSVPVSSNLSFFDTLTDSALDKALRQANDYTTGD